MKIEDVEELDKQWHEGDFGAADRAIAALRAEAWHPIEKAEELGVNPFRRVVLQESSDWFTGYILAGKWYDSTGSECYPTHFRFINPPEGA